MQGYFFAGDDSTANVLGSAWESWYRVTLTAGTATLALTNVTSEVDAAVDFFDGNTNSIGSH